MTLTNDTILYHGATAIVREPLTHVGRSDLDFGPGFYLTNDRAQAKEQPSERMALGKLIKEELKHQVCIPNQEIIDRVLVFTESVKL